MTDRPESPEREPQSPKVWPKIDSRRGPDLTLFRVRWDQLQNPRNGLSLERLVLETPEWVNVVAFTRDREVVLVRQYRFGVGAITTEIPGGMVSPGEPSETAARRELREETGFTAPNWRYLGAVQANPAFHDNLCHHWLAEEAEPTASQEQDEGEDVVVLTKSLAEIRSLIQSGEIRHPLCITALARFINLADGMGYDDPEAAR